VSIHPKPHKNAPALSAANMSNFPTLNQNTSGTAAGLSATLVVGSGGTGATSASGARTNLGATGKYAQTFGDGATTSYLITHNLATNDVIVGVYFVGTPFQVALCEVQLTSANTVTLVFPTASTWSLPSRAYKTPRARAGGTVALPASGPVFSHPQGAWPNTRFEIGP
jgi:hypothetical protein